MKTETRNLDYKVTSPIKLHVLGICNGFIGHYYNVMHPYIIKATFPNVDTGKLFFYVCRLEIILQGYIYLSPSLSLFLIWGNNLDKTQGSYYYSLCVNGYCDIGYYISDHVV